MKLSTKNLGCVKLQRIKMAKCFAKTAKTHTVAVATFLKVIVEYRRFINLSRDDADFVPIEKYTGNDKQKIEDLKHIRSKFIDEHRLGCCELYNWKTPARIEWEQTEEGKRILKEQQAARRKKHLLDTHREEVRAIFDNFDLDGNGEMDTNELHNMLVNEMCIPMKKKDVAAIAKELDENGNGIIDFEEFLEWYVMEIIEEGKWSGKSLSRARLKLRKNMTKMKEGLDDWYINKFPYKRPKVKVGGMHF